MKRIVLTLVLLVLVVLAIGAVALAGSSQQAPSLSNLDPTGGGGPA
jgi:hypothetical protein